MSDPSAGGPTPYDSPNPHRLYRNPHTGMVAGVCAGLADFLGVAPILVRAGLVMGLMFAFFPVTIAYLVATFGLPVRPANLYRNREEEAFWRSVATKPDRSLAGLAQRIRGFETRVGGLEAYVASKDFELNRAFRDLNRN